MKRLLVRLYGLIGIHASPAGTLFHFLDSRLRGLAHRRVYRYASGRPFQQSDFGGTPYYDIAWVRDNRPVRGIALIFFIGLGDYTALTR